MTFSRALNVFCGLSLRPLSRGSLLLNFSRKTFSIFIALKWHFQGPQKNHKKQKLKTRHKKQVFGILGLKFIKFQLLGNSFVKCKQSLVILITFLLLIAVCFFMKVHEKSKFKYIKVHLYTF